MGTYSFSKSLSVTKLARMRVLGLFFSLAVMVTPSWAQTLKTLVDFDGSNGATPYFMLQGRDGNVWGTTYGSGSTYCGTVYKMTPTGIFTPVLTTQCSSTFSDGNEPEGMVQGTDGNFYGIAGFGGTNEQGSVFKLTPKGVLTTLVSFDGSNGSFPVGTLTQGTDGNLYGATYGGGDQYSYGTVFKVTTKGVLTTLYQFDFTHGAQPYAGLIQGTDGNLYGATYAGGAYGGGAIYKITPQGILTVVFNMGGQVGDPRSPVTPLVQGNDGNFYGVTSYGGIDNYGGIFKVTPGGAFSTLYSFSGADGYSPIGPLFVGSDGNFWGTTAYNTTGQGTLFKITPNGTLTTVHVFDGNDGAMPVALIEDTSGTFYGLTNMGGTSNAGTIFSLSDGLSPFVGLLFNSGKVGASIGILGQGLKTTKSVSFNGKSAKFTVVSGNYLTATVPTGATSGFVTVQTSTSTLQSNRTFVVAK